MMGYAVSMLLALLGAGNEARSGVGPVGEALFEQLSQGLAHASVGDWAEYEVRGGAGRSSYWRLAAVDEEADERGRPALWIEIEVGQHAQLAAPLAQIRMLVAKRTGLEADGITRLFVALGSDRPQEVPAHSMQRMRRELRLPPSSTFLAGEAEGVTIESGRQASLMTGAGTIRSVPIEVLRAGTVIQRIWISDRIPLLHLSKLEVPAIGYSMVVGAFGMNATPRMILPSARRGRDR